MSGLYQRAQTAAWDARTPAEIDTARLIQDAVRDHFTTRHQGNHMDNKRIEAALNEALTMFREGKTIAEVETYLEAETIAAQEPTGRAA